jgi:hypothetical protein
MKKIVENQPWGRYRLIILIFMIVLIPLGLATKAYQGPAQEWINGFSGDILYEIFWVFFVTLIWPKTLPAWVATGVFLITCIIEFLQLWQPPALQALRATMAGKLLLGTTFVWADFPHYLAGCLLAWLGLRYLRLMLKLPQHFS